MKKVILIFAMIIVSCKSSSEYTKFSYSRDSDAWVTAYKDHVFFACLKESYSNDTIFSLINKKDLLNPYDGLGPEDIKRTKELAKNLIINMPKPVMCESCKEGQNYYMAVSLHYYKSRDLDSIAKSAYFKHKKDMEKMYEKE